MAKIVKPDCARTARAAAKYLGNFVDEIDRVEHLCKRSQRCEYHVSRTRAYIERAQKELNSKGCRGIQKALESVYMAGKHLASTGKGKSGYNFYV